MHLSDNLLLRQKNASVGPPFPREMDFFRAGLRNLSGIWRQKLSMKRFLGLGGRFSVVGYDLLGNMGFRLVLFVIFLGKEFHSKFSESCSPIVPREN